MFVDNKDLQWESFNCKRILCTVYWHSFVSSIIFCTFCIYIILVRDINHVAISISGMRVPLLGQQQRPEEEKVAKNQEVWLVSLKVCKWSP